MYCDKLNVNTLTALLADHGVQQAVVCPGSRNAPIVHNLDECPEISCFPVTDERSAGFYALGMALHTGLPTVVCVTSGTALLNLAPAVAEAYYRHISIVVISADRPPQWIDQLDGQTLPQSNALGLFVRKAVTLPEFNDSDSEGHWLCNRRVNEALLYATQQGGGPVHINVPLSRPLYNFSCPSLPHERKIVRLCNGAPENAEPMLQQLYMAKRPLFVIGQTRKDEIPDNIISILSNRHYVVLQEPLSGNESGNCVDEMMHMADRKENAQPDFILYIGGTLVSSTLKDYLRRAKHAVCWRVDETGTVADTFMNLCGIVQARSEAVLRLVGGTGNETWYAYWQHLLEKSKKGHRLYTPGFSSMLAVKKLEENLRVFDPNAMVHYANSMPVRLGCIYAQHHIDCNRGVNGIDGSLSTAAGCSLVTPQHVYCVIGDLSFFYDRNALWNKTLKGNLRVLLLNNKGGGIFEKFATHLDNEPDRMHIMARHNTLAQGFCLDNNIEYRCANNEKQLDKQLLWLSQEQADRPMVLEVMTRAENDWHSYQEYFNKISTNEKRMENN